MSSANPRAEGLGGSGSRGARLESWGLLAGLPGGRTVPGPGTPEISAAEKSVTIARSGHGWLGVNCGGLPTICRFH